MNKIIITALIFLSASSFAQKTAQIQKGNTINIDGVELSYNRIKKTMTLIVKPEIMRTNDDDMYTVVKISKSAELRIIINGETISASESFFSVKGHILESFWVFTTYKPSYCDGDFYPVTGINKYVFYHINPGDEYILSVSNLCDDKYQTNYKSKSIIIK
jgi:hypothetical protein